MKIGLAMAFALSLMFGAVATNDKETLQGTWSLSSGEAAGKALSEEQLKDGTLVIEGDLYSVTIEGLGTMTGEQILNPRLSPKTIDIMETSGTNEGATCLGIYELEGDEFRVAFAPPGKPRPTTFSPASDSGNWLHVWKRVTE